jgi:hypothetical protein
MRPTNLQYSGQQNQFEDAYGVPSLGGQVMQFTAGASLNVGDAVQISGSLTVNKATTNPSKVIGIVVGGQSMQGDGALFESQGTNSASDIALIQSAQLAAIANQTVFILTFGVFYVIADGAIANGAPIKISASTAGRVTSGTVGLTINAGATAVTSSAANGAIVGGDGVSGVFGTLIGAATVNPGDVSLAFINV